MTKPKRHYKCYSSEFKRWRDELALVGKDAFPGRGFARDKEVVPPPEIAPQGQLPSEQA